MIEEDQAELVIRHVQGVAFKCGDTVRRTEDCIFSGISIIPAGTLGVVETWINDTITVRWETGMLIGYRQGDTRLEWISSKRT